MRIITTVGTSIFDKLKDKKVQIDNDYADLKNKKDTYLKEWADKNIYGRNGDGGIWHTIINSEPFKSADVTDLSAEISSIIKIADGQTDVSVHLIATDTVLSVLAAELIRDWFGKHREDISIAFLRPTTEQELLESEYVIKDLRITSNTDYEKGFMRLIEVLDGLKLKPTEAVLNITGGYKAIIPIMTLYGQLQSIPLKYIYDESELAGVELVELGNLPINFDWDYIFHWELLLRPVSLEYISLIYDAMLKLDEAGILNHQHLSRQPEFLNLGLSGNQRDRILLEEVRKKLFPIYKQMLDEKVLKIEDGHLKPTVVGSMLQRYANKKQFVGSTLMGGLIEGFSYKFFSTPERGELADYSICKSITFQPTYYTYLNNVIALDVVKNQAGVKEAKDIDIVLEKSDGTLVLGECKSIWAYINKATDDYKGQIKARLLKQLKIDRANNINRKIELLFIVINFEMFFGGSLEFDNTEEHYQSAVNASVFFDELSDDTQLIDEFSQKENFAIKTAYITRKLLLTSDYKIDWNHFLIHSNKSDFNTINML